MDSKSGRRAEYHNAGDWRNTEHAEPPLPVATISREHGVVLRRLAAQKASLQLTVENQFYDAPSANVIGQLDGTIWPDEHLVLGGHHDTVMSAPGGNDNASGTIAVLETARVLSALKRDLGVSLRCAVRFVTFAAEEQVFQGAIAYIA